MERIEIGKYVVADPKICHGQLTFKGTRVMVSPVLAMFAHGETMKNILESYPSLTPEMVKEAQLLAIQHLIDKYPGGPQPWEDDISKLLQEEIRV